MTKPEATGWRIRQLLPGVLGGTDPEGAADAGSALVRLLDSSSPPQTPIQRALMAALKEAGGVSLEALVKRVTAELYREELRQGAAVLDIGLFGDRLFNRDVVQEVRAGNGIFWEIKPHREVRP